MAHRIDPAEIVDYETYEDTRADYRAKILLLKAARRVHVGRYLTFLFENHDTLRYQIQEIVRSERIVRADAIAHEVEVYNSMLGGPGELGAVLLIEIEDAAQRATLLREWFGLQEHLYVELADGTQVYACIDPAQLGADGKLSSVQYLRFAVPSAPVAVGTDFEPLTARTELNPQTRQALAEDLAASLV